MLVVTCWSDVSGKLGGPTAAEEQLREACAAGTPCDLSPDAGDGPDGAGRIRAPVLAYFARGGGSGCAVARPTIHVTGALIEGRFDLSHCDLGRGLGFEACRFDAEIDLSLARLHSLSLKRCRLDGLRAPHMELRGSLDLSGSSSAGAIWIAGSTIGGQLNATGTRLRSRGTYAINAHGSVVSGDVFLRRAVVRGDVSFAGALVRGQLDLDRARLRSPGGDAFDAQATRIEGGLIWRQTMVRAGAVDLHSAHASFIEDGRASDSFVATWPSGDRALRLAGLSYDGIRMTGVSLADRLDWLDGGSRWRGVFYPQPYTQFARILKASGHDAEARRVQYHRDILLRAEIRGRSGWTRPLRAAWDVTLRGLVGHGYYPFRALGALVVLVAAAAVLAWLAWREGSFAPASAVLLTSGWPPAAYINAAADWSETLPGRDWETFHPIIWGADLVIPIVGFGQVDAWQPSAARGGWGWWLWALAPVLNAAGWLVTALGAAAVTGLVRRE